MTVIALTTYTALLETATAVIGDRAFTCGLEHLIVPLMMGFQECRETICLNNERRETGELILRTNKHLSRHYQTNMLKLQPLPDQLRPTHVGHLNLQSRHRMMLLSSVWKRKASVPHVLMNHSVMTRTSLVMSSFSQITDRIARRVSRLFASLAPLYCYNSDTFKLHMSTCSSYRPE